MPEVTRSRARKRLLLVGLALTVSGAVAAVAAGFGMPTFARAEPLDKRVRTALVSTPMDAPELTQGRPVYREDSPARPGQVLLYRTERRYLGGLPTPAELQFYLRQGMGDAFLHALRPEFREAVLVDLAPVEAAFGAASLRRHQEIETAMAALAGTQDEAVIESQTEEGRLQKRQILHRRNTADRSRELWVSRSTPRVELHYRIDLVRFPAVLEFEQEAARHDLLRRALAHERIATLLNRRGVDALDGAALAMSNLQHAKAPVGERTR